MTAADREREREREREEFLQFLTETIFINLLKRNARKKKNFSSRHLRVSN